MVTMGDVIWVILVIDDVELCKIGNRRYADHWNLTGRADEHEFTPVRSSRPTGKARIG